MDFYTAHVIARLEHEDKLRRMPRVYDFGGPVQVTEPRWAVRQILRLLNGARHVLVSTAYRPSQGQGISAGTSGVQTKTQEIPC
jgi:hypothetical protein